MKPHKKPPLKVKTGQRVLVVWNSALKLCGRVVKFEKMMQINGENLMTYTVKCDDGFLRPAHARHIKKVY